MANPLNNNNSNNMWNDFVIYAQKDRSSQYSLDHLNQAVQRIVQVIKTMPEANSDLLNLKQHLLSVLNDNTIRTRHKKSLAENIQKAIEGRAADSGLKNIQSDMTSYLGLSKKTEIVQSKANQVLLCSSKTKESSNLTTDPSNVNVNKIHKEFPIKSLKFASDEKLEIDASLQEKLKNLEYFKLLISGEYKEQETQEIAFDDITKENFLLLIEQIKKSESLTLQKALNLFGIADYFQVSCVREKCYKVIKKFIKDFDEFNDLQDMETFIEIYKNFSHLHEISHLIFEELENDFSGEIIIKWIREFEYAGKDNFLEFLKSISFKRLEMRNFKGKDCKDFTFFKKLTFLKEIVLPSNGKVSKILGNLPESIEKIDFSECRYPSLEDELMEEMLLDELSNITHPNLKEVDLSNYPPAGEIIKKLPKTIVKINLHDCKLTDEDLAVFREFDRLEVIDLSLCKRISDKGLLNLPQSLKRIKFECSELDDNSFIFLKNLQNLEEIILCDCSIKIYGDFLAYLSKTIKKIYFNGSCKKLSGKNLIFLKECSLLEEIIFPTFFSDTNITCKHLANLPIGLKRLDFTLLPSDKKVDDDDLSFLSQWTNLKELKLSVSNVSGKFLSFLTKDIKIINLSDCNKFSGTNLALLKDHSNLEKLILPAYENITSEQLAKLPHTLKKLRIYCDFAQLNDENLFCLKDISLEVIHLSFSDSITDKGLATLPKTLKIISLYNFHKPINFKFLEHFPHLEMLIFNSHAYYGDHLKNLIKNHESNPKPVLARITKKKYK